jgi:exonuclease SbcC
MEILSVTLKNFKSHSDRHFNFQPGTNAICGENGAGKTSILEAIAWTLFNYRGAYRNEDLIRNGAASAQVRVVFVSNRDQRTYEISRCTRAGYTIYDPQLGERLDYSRIEEEIVPWLRQQFGVAPGTDLSDLFARTIGVPQGTFTADFLKAPKERKQTFDAILKVEEYRQTGDQLLSLEKYAKAEVESLERTIAQYEEALQDWEPLQLKRHDLRQEIAQAQTELQQCQQQLQQLQVDLDRYSTQAAEMQRLTSQVEQLQSRIQAQTQLLEQLKIELQRAEHAVTICKANRENYQTFLQIEATLRELEQQQQAYRQVLDQRQKQFESLSDRQVQVATITQQLERLTHAQSEIAQLQPLIQQQTDLEQQQQQVSQQLQDCQSLRQSMSRDEKRLRQLRSRQTQLAQEIERLRGLSTVVQRIPQLEQQQQRYQQQLSRVAAAAQFEADLRQIVTRAQERGSLHDDQFHRAEATLQELQQAAPLWTPAIAHVLATLRQGSHLQEHLMTDLQKILADLAEQTSTEKLKVQIDQVQAELQTARQQQAQYLTLDARTEELAILATEALEAQTLLEQSQTKLTVEPELRQKQADLTEQIITLNDPRGRSRLLQRELQQQTKLHKKLEDAQRSLHENQEAIARLDQQLNQFADLSQQMQTQQDLREQHRPAYREYLEHQKLANSFRDRESQLQATLSQFQELTQQANTMTSQRDLLAQTYDPQQFQAVQTAYQSINTQTITLNASLPEKAKRLDELEHRLQELQTTQNRLLQAQADLKQKEKVRRFITFSRKAYKEAGPRITERYLQSISREADKLFQELLNRPNVSLEWTRDYEIVVQEGAHSRRLTNLSGGEQMCAALAVRLALLKVLADIDIAFFDEPTTNMDRIRREHLAEAIANIKTFRQLFVISHDDTFEKITENVIVVERED